MDAWKCRRLLEHHCDQVRTWAKLEGKSLTMSEDLQRRYAAPRKKRRNALTATGFLVELTGWLVVVWRLFDSR